MSPVYFISDAHLGSQCPHADAGRETQLLRFFESIEDSSHLFILGDLFDVWFEYRNVLPKAHFGILFGLKKLSERNVRISFLPGNHDFWIQNFFSDCLGMEVHRDSVSLEIQGLRIFAGHGDGLASGDGSYRALKTILRNPFHIRLYRCIHPDIGIPLAAFFSKLSRKNPPKFDFEEDYLNFARMRFAEGFDGVILGHTHLPREYRENGHTYVNTGDWIQHFTYARLENGKLTLEHWK